MKYLTVVLSIPDNIAEPFGLNEHVHSSHQKNNFWKRAHLRNLALSYQQLYCSDQYWKTRYDYHERSLSETAIFLITKLLERTLNLRNHNTQISATYATIKALNKLVKLDIPKTKAIAQ